jgi:hypothetical protein
LKNTGFPSQLYLSLSLAVLSLLALYTFVVVAVQGLMNAIFSPDSSFEDSFIRRHIRKCRYNPQVHRDGLPFVILTGLVYRMIKRLNFALASENEIP